MYFSLLLTVVAAAPQDVRVPHEGYVAWPDRRTPAEVPALTPQGQVQEVGARATAVDRPAAFDSVARAAAQHEPRQLESSLVSPLETTAPARTQVEFDVDERGTHWVRGVNYKASFGRDGADFVPFLGSHAPRNFPVRFQVEGARRGGEALTLAPLTVQREADRVVLDRGALRSEYIIAPEGLEQRFAFDAAPGSGDLVLDLAFTTELAPVPDGAGWRFLNGLGGVSYGAALVLDAAGRELPLATQLLDGALRFTVPASFLADATWPVVIDPLIASVTVSTAAIDQLEPDVAYDPTTDRYLVVVEEVFSATDHDVRSWFVSTNGLVSFDAAIDVTSANRVRPRVACTAIRRSFLVTYVEGASGGLGRRIGARPRHADSGVVGTAFLVDASTAVDRLSADICGDSFTGGTAGAHFTIVWQRFWNATDSDIVARIVDEDGTLLTSEIYITNTIAVSDEDPTISKCIAPATSDSVIAWRRRSASGLYEVFGSLLRFDGALFRAPLSLSASAGRLSAPQVSGLINASLAGSAAATFLACWSRDYTTDSDVQVVVASGSSNIANAAVVAQVQALDAMQNVNFTLDQVSPDVATLQDRWIISYAGQFPGASDKVIRSATVNLVGLGIGISDRYLGLTGTFSETLTPKIASRYEHGELGSREALTAWIQQSSLGLPGDVYGAVHSAPPDPTCAAQFQFCQGLPNAFDRNRGSFMYAVGTFAPTGGKSLRAEGMTTNAFGYFLCSLSPALSGGTIPPGSSGRLCLGGAIGRYSSSILNTGGAGAFSLSIDPTQLSQPTGPVAAMSGQTWYFQAWHRDVTVSGAATSNFSNAVGLPFQ
ncbi:MAG: hypothetical protein R3F49_17345 [Planctomycetota bacterium]